MRSIEPILRKGWTRKPRPCPCGGTVTHIGLKDGIALTLGCELCMRRWARGRPNPGRIPVNGFNGDE